MPLYRLIRNRCRYSLTSIILGQSGGDIDAASIMVKLFFSSKSHAVGILVAIIAMFSTMVLVVKWKKTN
ncbi:Uncharacterised protein [Mannheimia haemolytica]|uniref:Uncharacterized protein n=1 Tax=Mannheimia haemolytica TaxID=75985 RepID=A0A378NB42_MANHA|nr:Uncharacterised protein [Mannheimia haemolytica]